MIMTVDTGTSRYDILLKRGALSCVGEVVGTGRRVCIVTDDGVPRKYVERVGAPWGERAMLFTFPHGEQSKSFDTYLELQRALLEARFTRKDAIIAVGGGVVGDLAGFAAATYMRGIDFYNVPTTVLAQVDSSVGGKTAVDFEGYKNMIGAFYPPRAVIMDPETLLSLERRQVAAGLVEAFKMALTLDAELSRCFLEETILPSLGQPDTPLCELIGDDLSLLERVIARAVRIKQTVVEQDEREQGLRRVLNFGHTLGHAVESCCGGETLCHGECVALGMLPMVGASLRPRVELALQRLGLCTRLAATEDVEALRLRLLAALRHDKKAGEGAVCVVRVETAGAFLLEEMTPEEIVSRMIFSENI